MYEYDYDFNNNSFEVLHDLSANANAANANANFDEEDIRNLANAANAANVNVVDGGEVKKDDNDDLDEDTKEAKGFMVLGMHRSGTSLLTGLLVEGFGSTLADRSFNLHDTTPRGITNSAPQSSKTTYG